MGQEWTKGVSMGHKSVSLWDANRKSPPWDSWNLFMALEKRLSSFLWGVDRVEDIEPRTSQQCGWHFRGTLWWYEGTVMWSWDLTQWQLKVG